SAPTLTNCTFAGNSAPKGKALACDSFDLAIPSDLQMNNCILWGGGDQIWNIDGSTITINYSDVQGGWPGKGNIDADPYFVETGYWDANGVWIDGDYHLLQDSPCIDTGDPNYIAKPNETDLDGKPRIVGGRIDMGAYESPIFAEARILPRTINLASEGNWITSYIWLPEGYDVADIESNSIFLENEIQPEQFSVDEQQQVATARFTREDVLPILEVGDINLTITGQLRDGTVFKGADIVNVTDKAGKKKK
ncbi:MAG: choice-of-anchor Q domain-containing protein, partial [Planctomycetota bacterium]